MKSSSARHLFLSVALIFVCNSFALGEEDSTAKLQSFLRDNIDLTKQPIGIVIGFIDEHGTRIVSYGKMDNGTEDPVNADTVFEIGSITKTFTVLLLEDMVQRGEMKLDDPVSKFLPASVKMPSFNGKNITLLDLATHMSGLPRNPADLAATSGFNPFDDYTNPFRDYTVEKLYAYLSGYKLRREPGSQYEYSNLGMGLLGHAIELKAGKDYESLVVERICTPLNMQSTRITLTPELKARLALGHDKNGHIVANWDLHALVGAGGMRSTVNDLLKYVAANLGLTPSPLTPLMLKTHVIRNYVAPKNSGDLYGQSAMSWMDNGIYQPPGMQLIGHGGGTGGYSTYIGLDKKQRRGIVVLSNQTAFASSMLGLHLLQKLPLDGTKLATIGPIFELVGVGIGLDIDKKTHTLIITKVVPNSSAAGAGLRAGTLIDKIGDVPTNDKSINDCLAMIRGPAGSTVQFQCTDPSSNQTQTVELIRQKFQTTGS